MTSTIGTSILYFAGCRASSMMGMTLGRFLAMFTRSLPALHIRSRIVLQFVYGHLVPKVSGRLPNTSRMRINAFLADLLQLLRAESFPRQLVDYFSMKGYRRKSHAPARSLQVMDSRGLLRRRSSFLTRPMREFNCKDRPIWTNDV